MTTTKKVRRRGGSAPRTDMYSKKKKGFVATSLRMTVEEAKLVREASLHNRMSTNLWMLTTLIPAAKKELAKAAKDAAATE